MKFEKKEEKYHDEPSHAQAKKLISKIPSQIACKKFQQYFGRYMKVRMA
jgi:hypothetical protein